MKKEGTVIKGCFCKLWSPGWLHADEGSILPFLTWREEQEELSKVVTKGTNPIHEGSTLMISSLPEALMGF